ncbi:MAG: BamA/TamA family outer membrane protein [Chitinophagales bacterium]
MRNKIFTFLMSLFFLSSCSVSKILNENEVLYTGTEFEFSNKSDIKKPADLKAKLSSEIYPKPNGKFLGLFHTRIWFYRKIKPNPKREKGFKYWLKYKVGQKPILMSDFNTNTIEAVLNKTMQDYGYFNTTNTFEIKEKKQKGSLLFTIKNNKQTKIKAIHYTNSNTSLDSLIKDYNKYEIEVGDAYNLKKLETDRTNLATEIRSLGYYDFDKKDIYYVIDTSPQNFEVELYRKIKPPKNDSIHKKYYISDINVYPSFFGVDSNFTESFNYKNEINIYQNFNYVGKKTLYENILIKNRALFSVKDYNYTAERLNALGVYKFIDIQYSKNEKDSLSVNIKLTPGKYQGVKFDISANTSNRSFFGSELSASYFHRNAFKGAENFTAKASIGIEFQFVDNVAKVNILEVNFEAKLGLPKLLIPFRNKKIRSGTPPRTFFSIEESYQQWLQYYTLNSLNFSFGYDWLSNKKHHHVLTPLYINFLSLLNTTKEFDEILNNNASLKASFENNVIIGSSYEFSLSSQKNEEDRNYFFFSAFIETAGNISYGISKAINPKKNTAYEILGIPFAQFTKLDVDFRHYLKISKDLVLASRLNTGVGFAYGNSKTLPYSKQFFMGGPNTIRAFPFRSLGPGNYSSETASESNSIEQSGDIKLLLNTELRFPLYKFIKAAVFLDAGNVWLREEDSNRPESQFKFNSFAQQIALGTGLGLRLDFQYIVIRADFGVPLHKPYNVKGQKWITDFPEQGFSQWQKENFVLNIAIGYPF